MTVYISTDIHPCKCGEMVAWVPSITGERMLPYEIRRGISIQPDGTRKVIVSDADLHQCGGYPKLAGFIQKAQVKSRNQKYRIRLPGRNRKGLMLTYKRGDDKVTMTNGRTGRYRRDYGSIDTRTGRCNRTSLMDDLADFIDLLNMIEENPYGFDWSFGGTQDSCCFCGRELTHPRSRRLGYGPICAAYNGLPW